MSDPHPQVPSTGNPPSVDPTLPQPPHHNGTAPPADIGETLAPAADGALRPDEAAAQRIAGYEVLGELGRGGMGVVYKARQPGLDRLVALKMILHADHAGKDVLDRFRAEARAVASLRHPNIVQIYEVGEHDGQPFYSMEFVQGGSLAQRVKEGGPLLPREAAQLVRQVTQAVQAAHDQGIIHRDIKPANVLLAAAPEGDAARLTDFGLARTREGGGSVTGEKLGTPSYMAPEQAAGRVREVSAATDVYGLGAVLYCLLTGRPPFQSSSPLETMRLVLEEEPVPVRQLNPAVPRDLETVCHKCLQKEPAKRYPSAAELAAELGRFLGGEPVRARPVGRLERTWRWCKRNPVVASLLALVTLLLLAGTTVSAMFAVAATRQARVAHQKAEDAEAAESRAEDLAESEQRTAYARSISLAYAEWRAGNVGSAEQVLSDCRPELRGWEWYYLRRLFRARQSATLEGPGGVLAVAFSPDGTRMAAAGAGGLVKLWDRRSLRESLTLSGLTGEVVALAFSAHGHRLAAGSADGEIRVWDIASGAGRAAWRGHAGGVTGLAFDPGGRRLASTGRAEQPLAGELKLWDPATGKGLAARASSSLLAAVAFRPGGSYLVTAGRDGSVTGWDAAALKPVLTFEVQAARTVPWGSVAFSADGRWLAAGSPEGLVGMWDAASARELFSAWTPTQTGVSGVAFAGLAARFLAAATTDNTVQGWVTRSGKPAFTLRGHKRAVTAVACSLDGLCLASGSLDRTVKLWDVEQRNEDLTLRPGNEEATCVAFSPDGARLAAAARDRVVKVWEAAMGKVVRTLNRLPAAEVGLAFSPEGSRLAGAGEDGTVRLRDAASGREVAALRGHAGRVEAVAFRADGAALASAGADGTVRVWEMPVGQERFRLGGGGAVHAVAYEPAGGRRLASGGEDGFVRVWDAATGRELLALGGPGSAIYAVAFSPDGRHLAAAGQDGVVRVWDATTGERVRTLRGHAGAVRGLAYGPGGRLASAGNDRAVRLWDEAGQELLVLRGHTGTLRAVAFSRDGHRLASASEDGTVKVWDATPLLVRARGALFRGQFP